jgi:hypothetical protein
MPDQPQIVTGADVEAAAECKHLVLRGRRCTCASENNRNILSWPSGPVPLLAPWARWLLAWPESSITRGDAGQLEVRRDRAHPATVIRACGRDSVVVDDEGLWPAVFPTVEIASAAARCRQLLRRYARSADVFRDEPCWLSPKVHVKEGGGRPVAELVVGLRLAEAMGQPPSPRRHQRKVLAYRASFLVFNGHMPLNGTVDHACYQPICVCPSHLDDVTEEENQDRALMRFRVENN